MFPLLRGRTGRQQMIGTHSLMETSRREACYFFSGVDGAAGAGVLPRTHLSYQSNQRW